MDHFINLLDTDLDRPIYRYVSFARLVEHFKTGKFGLAKTEKWDDPFENYIAGATYKQGQGTIKLALRRIAHGSCWTRKGVSDAMWRIYSSDKLAVRISSTPRLLGAALTTALSKADRSRWYIGSVTYLPQSKILERAENLAKEILKSKSDLAAAKSFLFKRNSFSHEDEIRILVIDRHGRSRGGILSLAIDPFQVINSILVDSRAPEAIFDVYKKYLKTEIGFTGRIAKSTLYRPPEQLVINLS